MSEIKSVTEKEFEQLIGGEKTVLVDFYANWCGPCKMQSPIIDEVAEELGDKIEVVKMDTDNCYDICRKYNIASIPTLMVFKDGQVKEKSVGLTDKKEISDMLIKYL